MGLPWELAEAIEELASGMLPRALAQASRDLIRRYRDRSAGPGVVLGGPGARPMWSDVHRAAYAVVRMPATFAAASAAMRAVAECIPRWSPSRLLDLGAGPATAAWAACEVFPGLESIDLVERDPGFIALGRRLASCSSHAGLREARWMPPLDLAAMSDSSVRAPSTSAILPFADLVLCSYALNEIPAESIAGLLDAAWESTTDVFILVEPGTPEGFSRILSARGHLIARGGRVVAPCPHDRACPLAKGPGWCHFSERLERSRRHRLAKDAALGFEDEKYSYVAVARPGWLVESLSEGVVRGRIVDQPSVSKVGVTLALCAASGLVSRVVQRREKAAHKRARKARWGDWWEE